MIEGTFVGEALAPDISHPFVMADDDRFRLRGDVLAESGWGLPTVEATAMATEYLEVISPRERYVVAMLKRVEKYDFEQADGSFVITPEKRSALRSYIDGITNTPNRVDTANAPRWIEALHYYRSAMNSLIGSEPAELADQKLRQGFRSRSTFYREMVTRLEESLKTAHSVHEDYLNDYRAEVAKKLQEEFGTDAMDLADGNRQLVNALLKTVDENINIHRVASNRDGRQYSSTMGQSSRDSE